MLKGLQNFLEFIVDNWTSIFIIICLIVVIVERIRSFFKKSKEERVAIAKEQIKQVILKMVSDAEVDYIEWTKAGSIKRSQVIQKIYTDYPVLSKIANQEQLTQWIDIAIDDALKTVRKVVEDSIVVEPVVNTNTINTDEGSIVHV